MALITTVGASDAESYADVTFADNYFTDVNRTPEWAAVGATAPKEAALRLAMTFIESLAWIGSRYQQTQALEWPRVGGWRKRWLIEPVTSTGASIIDLRYRSWPVTAIPSPIKKAQCEMALAIAQDASWIQPVDDVELIRTGVVTLRAREGSSRRGLPLLVQQWLDGFLVAQGGAVRLMKA